MSKILVIGLEEAELDDLKARSQADIVHYDMLPRVQIIKGELVVEHPHFMGQFIPVQRVVFHGIFENDFPLLSALALWGGPCLPNALGMMNCRLRIPCLVRALQVTSFGNMVRSYTPADTKFVVQEESVAKWGEWHCGENKEHITDSYTGREPTLIEPFIQGTAVRLHVLGDQVWQIRMHGDTWKKSIHHPDSGFEEVDAELRADTLALQEHFGLEMLAVDYMVGTDGSKHLLEVNHIPNVTQFAELRQAYLEYLVNWLAE